MGALSPTMSVLLGDFVRGAGVEEDDEAEVEEDGGEEAAEAEAMTLEPETLIEADGLPVAYDEVREGGDRENQMSRVRASQGQSELKGTYSSEAAPFPSGPAWNAP